jgi:Arc-like DNA binding domain
MNHFGKGATVTRDPTTTAQLKFRVQERLRARLDDAADAHGLTLNAEIIRRLEESFELDQKRRELEIEREYVRSAVKESSARLSECQDRNNKLTDFLLQITTKNLRIDTREESK